MTRRHRHEWERQGYPGMGSQSGLGTGTARPRRLHPLTLRFSVRRGLNWVLNLVFPDEQKNCLLCHRPMPKIEMDTKLDGNERLDKWKDERPDGWSAEHLDDPEQPAVAQNEAAYTMFEGVCLFCLQDAMNLYHQEISIRYLRVPGPGRGRVGRESDDRANSTTGPDSVGMEAGSPGTAGSTISTVTGSMEAGGHLSLLRVPVVAAAVYEGLMRTAIRQWKYDGVLELTPWFAQGLVHVFRHLERTGEAVGTVLGQIDAMVPVPSSADRFKKRGYDHVLLLANSLEKILGIPVASVLLRRSAGSSAGGFTQSQTAKSARERLAGLSGSYMVRPGTDLTGQRVVLLDDIVTTGATLYTCAHALYEAGAMDVIALVLADVK